MKNIVIVEDDHTLAHMYKLKLEAAGLKIKLAENGEIGLIEIEQMKPDLVLLDLRMPVMNGEEMLRKLRGTDWGKNIKVIILTNISRDEAPRTLWHLNIGGYIVKANSTPRSVLDLVQATLSEK